jgi:hypothetical protein
MTSRSLRAAVATPLLAALAALATACSPSVAQPASSVIGWAVGPGHLGTEPPSGAYYILAASAEAAEGVEAPVERKCFKATSFLPAPTPDTRIFVLLGGNLHALATRNSAPEPLTGGTSGLFITRLLAFSRPPSALSLLVSATRSGAQKEQIWLLTPGEKTITADRELVDDRAFVSQEAFFKAYDAPRCQPGGTHCLVLSSDGASSYVDVESVRGKKPEGLKKLGNLAIADAAYAPGDGKTIYLLLPCAPPS